MIDYLKYILELRRLKKESEKLSREFDEVAEGYNGQDDQGHLSYLANNQLELDYWIEYQKTAYFKKKADKLLLPMPDISDQTMYMKYDFGDEDGPLNILTTAGIYKIRSMIREERKAKREVIAFWFTILTGLIGATIGLISVAKA